MRHRRQAITLTADQLALVLLEAQTTGLDRASVVRRCVSTSLSHLRGGSEYKAALAVAQAMRGDDDA